MPINIDEVVAGRLERVAPRAFRMFGVAGERTLESTGGGVQQSSSSAGLPNDADARAIADALKRESGRHAAAGPVAGRDLNIEADAIAAQLVARANEVLAQLRAGGSLGEVSAEGAYALESVMRVRGRPALNVEGDSIEPIDGQKHPGSEFWLTFRSDYENDLVSVASATGAVMVKDRMGIQPNWVQGTAWLVKSNLVMTNRHVLFPPWGMRLARRTPGETTTARFKSDLEVTIDFSFDDRQAGRPLTCPVSEVLYVSQDADPIDVALIRIGSPVETAQELPAPLSISSSPGDYQYIYVMGHPGKMPKVPENVLAVFGTPNERKRVSFGETIDTSAPGPNEFLHDASTIGGYSGGCVLPFLKREVIGLHYYGDPLSGNRAFTAAALRAHPVGQFL
ncbi:trypsin-like serine peptidase [Bradyrhizobium paxllaeri]|uniref:trypsin-like serine peptidase n=1 Tax=Bradyrhizobium paxllaeri TaxID=190148 RepID=UPI000810D2FB|nr:serine protease [Bradyrhizobium paxllaeri]